MNKDEAAGIIYLTCCWRPGKPYLATLFSEALPHWFFQIQAQRSEFVEYLLQLQYVVDPIAQYIIDYFAEARAELSIELTELNEEGVIEITSGMWF